MEFLRFIISEKGSQKISPEAWGMNTHKKVLENQSVRWAAKVKNYNKEHGTDYEVTEEQLNELHISLQEEEE